jgi:transcriptional regulator of acetoin/glycerol metabolism
MLASLQGVFRPIVVRWTTGVALSVLSAANTRTLVLEDVDALSRAEQEQLFLWLKDKDRTVQVVATTSRPLAQLVNSGEFDSHLYYALNVIHIRIPS